MQAKDLALSVLLSPDGSKLFTFSSGISENINSGDCRVDVFDVSNLENPLVTNSANANEVK